MRTCSTKSPSYGSKVFLKIVKRSFVLAGVCGRGSFRVSGQEAASSGDLYVHTRPLPERENDILGNNLTTISVSYPIVVWMQGELALRKHIGAGPVADCAKRSWQER